jgi:hypothetical protein
VTTHVAAAVAFNEVPLTVHPVPVKVRVPVPDPPDVSSVIAVPAVPVSVVFDTVSVAWAVTGPVNKKVSVVLMVAK